MLFLPKNCYTLESGGDLVSQYFLWFNNKENKAVVKQKTNGFTVRSVVKTKGVLQFRLEWVVFLLFYILSYQACVAIHFWIFQLSIQTGREDIAISGAAAPPWWIELVPTVVTPLSAPIRSSLLLVMKQDERRNVTEKKDKKKTAGRYSDRDRLEDFPRDDGRKGESNNKKGFRARQRGNMALPATCQCEVKLLKWVAERNAAAIRWGAMDVALLCFQETLS